MLNEILLASTTDKLALSNIAKVLVLLEEKQMISLEELFVEYLVTFDSITALRFIQGRLLQEIES